MKMRFNLMAKNLTTYFTELNEQPIQIEPLEEVTFIQLDQHKYVVPYGLQNYKMLSEQMKKNAHNVQELFSKTIKALNVNPYGHVVAKLREELAKIAQKVTGDELVLVQVLNNYLDDSEEAMINQDSWQGLIQDTFQAGGLTISDSLLAKLYEVAKQESPEIHNDILPTLMELIKQIDQQGILDDLIDPTQMLKDYANRG